MTIHIPIFGTDLHAIIDDADSRLAERRWHAAKLGYAKRSQKINGRVVTLLLHREVMGLSKDDGRVVDHINGDKLDNRRCNLRLVTLSGNRQNLSGAQRNSHSGIRGVGWHAASRKWQARVTHNGRTVSVGYFRSKTDADTAVSQKRKELGFLSGAAAN